MTTKKSPAQLDREVHNALVLALKRGDKVSTSGYPGTVERVTPYKMVEVRLRSGVVCVDPGDVTIEGVSKGNRHHSTIGRHVAHHALMHDPQWHGSKIQSLLFDKQWTVDEAKDWASSHGYHHGKVHVTDNYIRLRQFEPKAGRAKRTITFGQGIKAIVEQEK
jgi:hypothetical protein